MKTIQHDKPARSQDEILAEVRRLNDNREYDNRNDRVLTLIGYLTNDRVKPLVCDLFNELQYREENSSVVSSVLAQMKDYMETAWENTRSVWDGEMSRTMHRYAAWIWMTGEDKLSNSILNPGMRCEDILRNICRHYGWDFTQWDKKSA